MRWVLIVVLVLSGTAFAADPATEEAKKHFDQGNVHYNLGEFREALAQYKEAYRIKRLPGFLFNIAQCHRKLGEHQQAVNLYISYLNEVPNAPNRADVEDLIKESRERLAEEQKTAAERARSEEDRRRAEEERKRADEAAARRAAEGNRVTATPEDMSRYDRHPARLYAYIGAGAGALIAGGGVLFAIQAKNAQSSFDDAGCGDPAVVLAGPALDQCEADQKDGKRAALLSNVMLGAGAAVVIGSVIVFFVDPGNVPAPRRGSARLDVGPGTVGLTVTF